MRGHFVPDVGNADQLQGLRLETDKLVALRQIVADLQRLAIKADRAEMPMLAHLIQTAAYEGEKQIRRLGS